MEKIVEQGMLYDFYGELLTEHQKQIYESFVYENLSLSEIAEEHNISRQAVHDMIKRCDKLLGDYEDKLKLVAKFHTIKERVKDMDLLISSLKNSEASQIDVIGDTLQTLTAEILQDL